ncbi:MULTISPECIES: conjugal transfer protein TraD [Brevundimonas]|jgi:hypothetical protein|uniref:Conjugal transfer TraD family protein n=1 Tax=Brevundimonas abyssalis TAR-001 TaxID=1391729 RepID=A0A8E0KJ13_9CAUL|nr:MULTISPECIES: conjugal transfer protein TraD [Brevundimonas]GAD58130.1 conjugal transfer TraD family protein [Brevundimonas abyssalis TAR-001]
MRRRADHHERQSERRARTRRLIELGGLVQKAGLVELTGDDRNVLFGGFLLVSEMLRSDRRDAVLAVLERKGRRGFRGDKESATDEAPTSW